MSSLYIHFPYCLYKCTYCDFNSYATKFDRIPSDDYVKNLLKEWDLRKNIFQKTGGHFFSNKEQLTTIFIGGGTPSLMSPHHVEKIIQYINRDVSFDASIEITLEANPKTITPQSLLGFKSAGINRLSLGVQSLNDEYLARFGRIHSADEAREAITWVSQTGFKSWSFDLIFGFPGQTLAEWQDILKEASTFLPPHLSCYSFTVEKDAPYSKMVALGKAFLPDEDIQAEMFEWTREYLTTQAYEAYEISNFAKVGEQSRHNLAYWNYQEYVGLGAGAVSSFKGYRTTNFKEPGKYMKAIGVSDYLWFDREDISINTAYGEFMMMGLRLKNGVSRDHFKKIFGVTIESIFGVQLQAAAEKGYLDLATLALTEKGQLVSNQVMTTFLSDNLLLAP